MNKRNRHLRVLIADDERLIADTLALILKGHGFDAEAVYSGETAVERAMLIEPDVLISDVIMDGISGIEAAIRIREMMPACRVILFSGMEATMGLLQRAGTAALDYQILAKPVRPEVLLEHLSSFA